MAKRISNRERIEAQARRFYGPPKPLPMDLPVTMPDPAWMFAEMLRFQALTSLTVLSAEMLRLQTLAELENPEPISFF